MKQFTQVTSAPVAEITSRTLIIRLILLLSYLSVLPTKAEDDIVAKALKEYVARENDRERGGPSIVNLIWDYDPPSPALVIALTALVALLIGLALSRALLSFENPQKPAINHGLRWASNIALLIPFVAFRRASSVSATELAVSSIVIIVMYTVAAFALGYGYHHFKNYRAASGPAARKFYAVALEELNRNEPDPGLWAQCLSKTNGNEAVAKANYLKARAADLSKNSQIPAN